MPFARSTGAVTSRPGRFELANDGTPFLDTDDCGCDDPGAAELTEAFFNSERSLDDIENILVDRAIMAAKRLGITRSRLDYRLKKRNRPT